MFLRLLVLHVLPYAVWLRRKRSRRGMPCSAHINRDAGRTTLTLEGACSEATIDPLLDGVREALAAGGDIALDLRAVTYLDPRALGALLLLEGAALRRESVMRITAIAPELHKVLRWNGMTHLLCASGNVPRVYTPDTRSACAQPRKQSPSKTGPNKGPSAFLRACLVGSVCGLLLACSTPEEKVQEFVSNGQELLAAASRSRPACSSAMRSSLTRRTPPPGSVWRG